MEFEDLLKALEEASGITGLEPDDMHMVELDMNGTSLTIFGDPRSRTVVLLSEIGDLPLESRGSFYELALKANWFVQNGGDAVLAISPETNALALNRAYPMDELDGEKFVGLVFRFASAISFWRKLAANWRGTAEDGAEETATAAEDFMPIGDEQVIRG